MTSFVDAPMLIINFLNDRKTFQCVIFEQDFFLIMTTDDSFVLEKKRSGTFFPSNLAEDKIALTIFPLPCHLCHIFV